ncbi:MAG: hypothetical protein KGJ73_12575 [Rhodospirillales bacterium]|nr:hypothetical protein [Rhodospirillales bacterium]
MGGKAAGCSWGGTFIIRHSALVREAPIDQDTLQKAAALCISNVLALRPVTALENAALPAVTLDEAGVSW